MNEYGGDYAARRFASAAIPYRQIDKIEFRARRRRGASASAANQRAPKMAPSVERDARYRRDAVYFTMSARRGREPIAAR